MQIGESTPMWRRFRCLASLHHSRGGLLSAQLALADIILPEWPEIKSG